MIVDVSKKLDVYRYAKASVELGLSRCNTVVAAKGAAEAYRHLPFLHPVPLRAGATCRGGRLYVEGVAEWQTGVEMDVLFGALVGAVASGAVEMRNMLVEAKVKGSPVEIQGELQEAPFERRGDLSARAFGRLMLKSLELVKRPVEKGHPLYAAQTAASLSSKRFCEIVGGVCPKIQHYKIDIEVVDAVEVRVEVKARDVSPAPEALFSAGVALLTIWDMLKKYEKDEAGQYPHTRITSISLD
ncbi:cyclic pyranopterin monophosphate synthase MoaC [Pyrobaculum calidifontis]|uniref:Molybdenum cofactor biosynthesis protein (MoaC) n=1 Tax=Pyrobaculum calidifontis (strain DSM 21063 / JCM 11548 / VA1) TaxID=410359 RepID=A3MS38_PYRCJ|nr:cyclic pyranopterin monophosphate synthase MoaC [Pyrobaculum calidifontis]ABO07455.1 molybdenum cofactor biosynthesis protein (moaC) [Pyrobaculum calidifontis JCM 11548]